MEKEQRGIRNWGNLFKKPTLQDWTILFMLIMALFIAWAYQRDIALCREYISQEQEQAKNYTAPPYEYNKTFLDNIILKEDNNKSGWKGNNS